MNFLAHFYLSGESEELLLGNYITDFIRGGDISHYNGEVLNGIKLHREIDRFTDEHPVFQQSVQQLRPRYRLYAGVIVDIFYDHFLAGEWQRYSGEPLEEYTRKVQLLLRKHEEILPVQSLRFLSYMERYSLPLNYREVEGIRRVMEGMARRASAGSNMNAAVTDLQENYELFRGHFTAFFPELVKHVEKIR